MENLGKNVTEKNKIWCVLNIYKSEQAAIFIDPQYIYVWFLCSVPFTKTKYEFLNIHFLIYIQGRKKKR